MNVAEASIAVSYAPVRQRCLKRRQPELGRRARLLLGEPVLRPPLIGRLQRSVDAGGPGALYGGFGRWSVYSPAAESKVIGKADMKSCSPHSALRAP